MKDDVAETLREIHKLTPAEGDVIAVKIPPHWDRQDMWEIIAEIREQGIKVVAFTEDVQLTVIKDTCSYLLQVPQDLSDVQRRRIHQEWVESFPKAPLVIISGGSNLIESPEPDPGMDTL